MLYLGNQKICPIITINSSPTYTYNVDFIGNNISVDGNIVTIQGISTDSYIKTKDAIINQLHNANSWKIGIDYNLLEYKDYSTVFATGDAQMSDLDYQGFNNTYEDGALKLFAGSDGEDWNIYAAPYIDIDYLLGGSEFLLEVEYTGSQYIVSITNKSLGETTPTVVFISNNPTKIGLSDNDNPTYLILGNNAFCYNVDHRYGAFMKFDLANSYYTIDGVTTYLAEAN